MKNVMKRINGLIRIAQKRQDSPNDIDRLIGRQVERNLRMAKRIIGEEIVQCGQCRHFVSPDEALKCGYINETVAIAMRQANRGFCVCHIKCFNTPTDGFCHNGERASKEQNEIE